MWLGIVSHVLVVCIKDMIGGFAQGIMWGFLIYLERLFVIMRVVLM